MEFICNWGILQILTNLIHKIYENSINIKIPFIGNTKIIYINYYILIIQYSFLKKS